MTDAKNADQEFSASIKWNTYTIDSGGQSSKFTKKYDSKQAASTLWQQNSKTPLRCKIVSIDFSVGPHRPVRVKVKGCIERADMEKVKDRPEATNPLHHAASVKSARSASISGGF